MTVTYCNGWSRMRKSAGQIWPEERARRAHDDGKLYCVLVGNPANPSCVIDLRLENRVIAVSFLDGQRRVYLEYQFDVVDQRSMFLRFVTYRDFEASSDQPSRTTVYKFASDGDVSILELSGGTERHGRSHSDPSLNWEPIPDFGQYEGVCRAERGLTVVPAASSDPLS